MTTMVDYRPDHKGTGELLAGPEMQALAKAFAEEGERFAVSISPDQTPYGEGYIDSFEVESGLVQNVSRSPRATSKLWNKADYAAAVEWRHDHHVLGRTVDHIEKWRP